MTGPAAGPDDPSGQPADPVEELSLDADRTSDPTSDPTSGTTSGTSGPGSDPTSGPDRADRPRRPWAVAAALVAVVLFAAWSGHAAGVVRGRDEGARRALSDARLLVWFSGVGSPDGAGRADVDLFAATGSGLPLTVRRLHVGADTVTPVRPLAVPAMTSTSSRAVVESDCGSARELELTRSGPGAARVGTLTAEVVDADGSVREVVVGLLPDDASFRASLRAAACREDESSTAVTGLRISAMTARSAGLLEIDLDAGAGASAAAVAVVPLGADGPIRVSAEPAGPVPVPPGSRRSLRVRLTATGCLEPAAGQPSVEGLFTLEIRTPGLTTRIELPGWDQGAVGQAAASAVQQACGR